MEDFDHSLAYPLPTLRNISLVDWESLYACMLVRVMLPRRRGRGRGQIPKESEGQNNEVQRSIPGRRHTRQIDDEFPYGNRESSTCVTLNGSGIQLAVGPTTIVARNHNFGLAHRIMVKRLATSPHDPLGITDSAFKNQLVMVSVQYGPFNTYIPIRSTTIGKSRVARDPIAMHTSWRSNSDIASVTRQNHLPKTHPVLWPEIYHIIISSDSI
ncbi:hypothetical protein F511_12552 [Dorcoceras hygrometricum]|uniref:Uncharacterized protein n=1 Tax=Dorcoceras hygrometricum TaxID=472368 RepID=A0A2Z7BRT5_9LAMI|nr:hypothetical protein F511_12552 [Dorcoceras hygrometricum]